MKGKRRLLRVTAVVAALGVAGWLADAAVAINVERTISRSVEDATHLPVPPRVYVGGAPYSAALVTGNVPKISTHVMDVDVPGFGVVNATTDVFNLTMDREQVLSGDLEGVVARVISRSVSLDGVALGEHLNMTDLQISHPYDISPSGGTAAEVLLTGTPEGLDAPVTVLARLRINGTTITMTPTELREGDAPPEVMQRFFFQIDSRELPLPSQASQVFVRGGSVVFESEQRNVRLDIRDLSPLGPQVQEITSEGERSSEAEIGKLGS
ncbi:hypothetical protein CCICO_09675 [Corynebacterium ciconiae DSM 44920]|uniref:LmeA family phospholipid-binding protein n=1 Tax=Corynebacterium ciconiae TaxID=227319 RepID=UPI0003A3CCFF|nr:DUF2993 domain-containing protein [Corynebacterium ciconiae]WKD61934.1 hypothetical protein CCICO_09675 [Corynebacterium ciconiae DSM 44920]